MTSTERRLDLARPRRRAAEQGLLESHPQVSAWARGPRRLRRNCDWPAKRPESLSTCPADLREGGHPVLQGDRRGVEGAAAVIVYGHQDVQPPDPFGESRQQPFKPPLAEGMLHARSCRAM